MRDLSVYGVIELTPEEQREINGGLTFLACPPGDWLCEWIKDIIGWPHNPDS